MPTEMPTELPSVQAPTIEPTVIPTTMEPTTITPTTFPPIPIVVVPEGMVSDPETVESIEETVLTCKGYNETEFILKRLPKMKSIVIRDNCFGNVRVFELDGLSELESVVIGQQSFTIDSDERSDYSYRIVNCPRLKSIQIGDESFWDYHSIELNNLPSLQSIMIGDRCFGKVRVFELDGLSELESVVIGKECFTYAKTYDDIWNSKRSDGSCRIVNCPKLKSIQIGYHSFSDCHSFELSNLPSLQSIYIGMECFYWATSFSLTGLID